MNRLRFAGVAVAGMLALTALALPVSSVAAAQSGQRQARGTHRARTFSFYARVIHSSRTGLLLKTTSGKKVWFSARELHKSRPAKRHHKANRHHKRHSRRQIFAHMAGTHGTRDTAPSTPSVTIDLVGLTPGVTVLVTESVDSSGNVTITITLPPPTSLSAENATGVITEVDSDAFMLQTPGGSDLRLSMAPATLAGLNLAACDTASVTYHQDADLLIADTVQVTGTAPQDCQSSGDATGTITSVSDSGVTINTDQGPLSFGVNDGDVTGGFQVGDLVVVSWSRNSDGTLNADDVEFVEQETTGVVTDVSSSSMTITDGTTSQPDVFVADGGVEQDLGGSPFDGVSVNDQVDVTYHVSAGNWVADLVIDNSSGGGSGWGGSGGDNGDGNSGGGD
jgi:hypothetical protein